MAWNATVNVGLPRTGTFSFILAARQAKMSAHHAYVQTLAELGEKWYDGVAPPKLLAYVESSSTVSKYCTAFCTFCAFAAFPFPLTWTWAVCIVWLAEAFATKHSMKSDALSCTSHAWPPTRTAFSDGVGLNHWP